MSTPLKNLDQSYGSSNQPIKYWRGALTSFNDFYDVFPATVIESGSWDEITNFVTAQVAVGPDKALLPFFVPCLLKDAPFTAKTLPRALAASLGEVGKQRSSGHVTEARWLVMDIDGLSESTFAARVNLLEATGCAFAIYSTYSHGRADKPGVRARLILPIDDALDAAQYERAWIGLDHSMFDGEVGKSDASGRHLWQQQGVWATSEEFREMAFVIKQDGWVWSSEVLISNAPVKPKISREIYQHTELSPSEQVTRLQAALPWIDAEDGSIWHTAVVAFKAVAGHIGQHNALNLALQHSERGSEDAKRLNEIDPRYNPQLFFESVNPSMPPDAGMGTLLGLAKQGAVRALLADKGQREWTPTGRAAAIYLNRYHYQTFADLVYEEKQ